MKYLYKYRDIQQNNLSECFNIRNLIDNKATISSRRCFNDPNDSKINFKKPTLKEYKLSKKQIHRKKLNEYINLKNESGFTKEAMKLFEILEIEFNKLIDEFGIYCLTDKGTDPFMWREYADNHRGFCIKFNKENFGENFGIYPITYNNKLPELNLKEILKLHFDVQINDDTFGKEIHSKLMIKLDEYRPENEYKYIMSGKLQGQDRIHKTYPKEVVDEVIFGWKMPIEAKKYIMEFTDFKYSQIIKCNDEFIIVPFDEKEHLKSVYSPNNDEGKV